MNSLRLPWALAHLSGIRESIGGRKTAFFLDLDGTLAPLVSHPDLTVLPTRTKDILTTLALDHPVCIVSGRDLADLRHKIGLDGVHYAADHGHHILGRVGSEIELEVGPEDRMELETASYELERRLRAIDGVVIEVKGASLSIHYRLVAPTEREVVHEIVTEVAESAPGLRLTGGKLVHELRPRIAWGKGRAMLWLLGQLRLQRDDACPICVGDDLTDEDMFGSAHGWGVSVIVGDADRETKAEYRLVDPEETAIFLESLAASPEENPVRHV